MMKFLNFLFFGLVFFCFNPAKAQWNSNVSLNTTVALVPKSQQNIHSVTDNKNGIIIGWDDNRNSLTGSTDIYAQGLNADGVAKWASSGVAICTNTNTQRSVSVVEDGNGGAILTWEDNRAGNYDIYAQKVDSNGVPQWTTDGVIITNGLTNQKNPKIVNDNAGGAIIVWEDSVNFYFDIYAQRINSTGTVVWTTNGVAICTSPNTQNNPKLDINGFGGAIITWQDKRTTFDYDIYAQNINSTGTVLWPVNGVAVCNAVNTQNNPRIEPDGANGAVIAWTDKRGGIDYDIYAQRLDASGAPQWLTNGIVICNNTSNQSALDIKYLGSSGVALSWKDFRGGNFDIYAQIISLTGTGVMAANGIKISNSLKSLNPNNISDGAGGVIIAWEDSTSVGWDITSQKINSLGALQWTAGGVTVCNAIGDQINVSQVPDGLGGAIYAWEDHRNATDYDVFAQHLYTSGSPQGIKIIDYTASNIKFYPNPAGMNAEIHLPNCGACSFEIFVYNGIGEMVKHEVAKNKDIVSLQFFELNNGIYHYTIRGSENAIIHNGTFILEK